MDNYTVGNQIALLRRNQGMTGEKLAELLGVSPQAVSKWENGKCLPDTALLPQLARMLSTSIDNILVPEPHKLLIEYAEKTDNADMLAKAYMDLDLFEDKNIEIVEDGIRKLLLLKSYNNAGELYLKLAGLNTELKSYISIEKQLFYCEKALNYLNKSTVKYAYCVSLHKYLKFKYSETDNIIFHYKPFGIQAKNSNGRTTLSFTFDCQMSNSTYKNPLCSDLPVMSGYSITHSRPRYYNKDKLIIDKSLAVNESSNTDDNYLEEDVLTYITDNAVVTTHAGKFCGCHVFGYKCNGRTVENYFAPDIGLVRVVAKEKDGRIYDYELRDYSIKGGEGLLPLFIGNKWSYKQRDCPDWAGQIIEREIVSVNGDCYNISGFDCIYLRHETFDTINADTIFDISEGINILKKSKLYMILLKRVESPQLLEIVKRRFGIINNGKLKPALSRWRYLKINSIDADGKYFNEANNERRLCYWFSCMSHLAVHADSAVRVFKQASFIGGKLYDPLWKPGFEQIFSLPIQTDAANTVLTTHDLCKNSLIYEQWRNSPVQSVGATIELPVTVKVTDAGTIEVLSGTFSNCIKVEFDCQKPDDACYFHPDQHLLYQSPFDVCGKKSIYYAPDIGIIKAKYDWDGESYTVELVEYTNVSSNGNYMPVYYGNSWCYKVTNTKLIIKDAMLNDNIPVEISLKYTISLPDESNKNKLMLFEEYSRTRKH